MSSLTSGPLTSGSYSESMLVVVGILCLVGCSSGQYSADVEHFAQRFLPSERTVAHHPDTLQALKVREKESVEYEMKGNLETLIEKWSATPRLRGTAQASGQRDLSYATFWSLELSLALLQPEAGILSLSKRRAQSLLEQRRSRYFDTIRIDVYWFGGNGIIAGPNARTKLHIADTTYRPVETDYGPIRDALMPERRGSSSRLTYRHNTLRFPRTVDGEDVLEGSSRVELRINRAGTTVSERLTWAWPNDETSK